MIIETIDAVSNFHIEVNATSPNVKDVAKRRVGHKQWETTRVIYFHKSWNGLWATFQINHPAIVEKSMNKKSPKVHPVVF